MDSSAIELVIHARQRSLGDDIQVRRSLPVLARRMVGPFIFCDHFGPLQMAPGFGLDIRPHPHIGLATVTYLLEGEIVHRDSLGSLQTIKPGDVNWMTAGRGIVHSERTGDQQRARGPRLHGMQCWVALPLSQEEGDPSFDHYPAATLPAIVREGDGAGESDGVTMRLIAGSAYGRSSPVRVLSPLFYVDAQLAHGAELTLPDDAVERALYVIDGPVVSDGVTLMTGDMAVFRQGVRASARAPSGQAHVVLLGGAPLEGERHVDWNFVSSSPERIAEAKADWRAGRFPKVPGDDKEFIPLP